MRTQLSQYCPQFDSTMRPLLEPLGRATAALEQAATDVPGRELRPHLAELGHHLQVLCEKVASQQAYVLIFGPLKSGKSTLMNAVAGTYVSEVSSLPAYPCLVFVSAGKKREYVVGRYDGSTETFLDPQALHRHIETAHKDLAEAIRKAEQSDLPFDPQEHFPQAIRRVDVRVPGSELGTTGAVLVDTPGLYTRMRFGYDRMTKDFRDAAACAIFVVKPDTLFLEQVFAEFEQLLNLFSRIFLVVNVDSTRKDLGLDGRLVPSLEQSRPEAILQAFEQLAMSAPLHRAAVEGRVKMYPCDLLHSASAVLTKQPLPKGDKNAPEKNGPDKNAADKNVSDPVAAEKSGDRGGFARFRADLSEFLASAEYLVAFVRDSLQRAHQLVEDLAGVVAAPPVQRLRERAQETAEQLDYVRRERAHVDAALRTDLEPAFARVERTVHEEVERSARDEGLKLLRTLGASIDTWFLSSHSLHWLTDGQWSPLLQDYRRDVERAGRRALELSLQQGDASLDLPAEIAALCDRRGIDVRAVREQALAALPALPAASKLRVPVDVAAIPVKKGMLDVVAFRSLDKIRDRLFGDRARPDVKIPGKDKAKYLGEPGRLHLHQCITQFRGELAPRTVAEVQQHLGAASRTATIEALQRALRATQPKLQQAEVELQQELARLAQALDPLQRLIETVADLRQKLPALAHSFGSALPAKAEVAERTVELQPEPRRRSSPAERSSRSRG